MIAQLSDTHYIPPITANQSRSVNRPDFNIDSYYLYISTPFGDASNPINVQISDGAGNPINTPNGPLSSVQVYKGSPVSGLELGATQDDNTQLYINQTHYSQVLTNKGIILKSDGQGIYASIRSHMFNQGEVLVSKGKETMGLNFRLAAAPAEPISPTTTTLTSIKNFFVSVMASEDGTQVTIEDYDPGIILLPNNTSPGSQINFTLDAGESYLITGDLLRGTNHNGIIGGKITSNKPIAVNTGNHQAAIDRADHTHRDIFLDQITATEHLGNEYIIVRSKGDDRRELALVIATENNTDIFVNGNTTPFATQLNQGDYIIINGSNYDQTSDSMYIESLNHLTSEPSTVVLYQFIAAAGGNARSGMNFVPPIDCFNQKEVDLIPDVDQLGPHIFDNTELHIITLANANVMINSTPVSPPSFLVPGNPTWKTYKIPRASGDIKVTSTGAVNVAVIGGGRNASNGSTSVGYGGYYSGFRPNIGVIERQLCQDERKVNLFEELPSNIDPNANNIVWSFIPNDGSPEITLPQVDSSDDGVWDANNFDPLIDRIDGLYQYQGDEQCLRRTIRIQISFFSLITTFNAVATNVCSGNRLGIELSSTNSGPSPRFNITDLQTNGLTITGGNPQIQDNIDRDELLNHAYTNSSSTPVDIVYTIQPISSDGCYGTENTITVTLLPEVVTSPIQN